VPVPSFTSGASESTGASATAVRVGPVAELVVVVPEPVGSLEVELDVELEVELELVDGAGRPEACVQSVHAIDLPIVFAGAGYDVP